MPKPEWLKDRERPKYQPKSWCRNCTQYGRLVGYTRRKDKTMAEVHECAIHPKCLNTAYSIGCDDYEDNV